MSRLYVPVVDHTNRVVGYVPPWFLGIFPTSVTFFFASIGTFFVPHMMPGSTIMGHMMSLSLVAVCVFLASFCGALWYWCVMESLFHRHEKTSFPAVRRLLA